MSLIEFTKLGPYCSRAGAYIDPWKPVDKAIITHGHSDHARWGHGQYLCTPLTEPVIQYRLGKDIQTQVLDYGKRLDINGVKVSFHPAGHIPGSAQVRLEYGGEVWVITGDYKVEDDGLSRPFERVKCHHFVTESTFALPIYRWEKQSTIAESINKWWMNASAAGKTCVISAYALGKAQRIMHLLDSNIGPIYTHGAVEQTNEVLREAGMKLTKTIRVERDQKGKDFEGAMVIAPPSALGSPWMKRFRKVETAGASGWMQVRGIKRRRGLDRGFVLSDHADWTGLLEAIEATEAENIYVTHGYTEIFCQYLNEKGFNAVSLDTEYGSESEDTA